jgi:hypothetical protein
MGVQPWWKPVVQIAAGIILAGLVIGMIARR